MDDEYMEVWPGDVEAYRRLDAYAEMRLAPDPAAMRRIRAAVMAAAATALTTPRPADAALAAPPATIVAIGGAPRTLGPRRRSRLGTALLAAALTLGLAVGGVSAAQPGGPLYGQRLWIEQAMLPASGEARVDAQSARLDERLAEARAAADRGDTNAIGAALGAYASILGELETQAIADPAVADEIGDDIERHLAVLTALLGEVPAQARGAIEHALDRSDAAIDHIDRAGSGRPSEPGAPGGGNNGVGVPGDPGAKPDKTTEPAAQPTPKAEPKPDKTPKPAKTPDPAPTPKPGRTPPPPADPDKKPNKTPGGQQGES